jgi:threonine aldolase
MQTIDLRSDFLAHPSDAMYAAAQAARDSRCFGLREDPWQRGLEARAAEMLAMEDALVFPTCSMANTTALLLAAEPGSRVLTQPDAHVLVSEAGAGAALGGLVLTPVGGVEPEPELAAMPPLAAWSTALAAGHDAQRPAVRLCVLENTHNRSGGIPLPPEYVDAVTASARAHGVRLHLDGARLFNAAQALGLPLARLTRGFDTVSLSLNKSLGAPIAAVLAGSRVLIERALVIRQRLGGGIRPTGPASAATLAALDDLGHFAQVQDLAGRLAAGLDRCAALDVLPVALRTNIVIARVCAPENACSMITRLAAHGLLAIALDEQRIRFVVYRGIDAAQIERAIAIAGALGPAS